MELAFRIILLMLLLALMFLVFDYIIPKVKSKYKKYIKKKEQEQSRGKFKNMMDRLELK